MKCVFIMKLDSGWIFTDKVVGIALYGNSAEGFILFIWSTPVLTSRVKYNYDVSKAGPMHSLTLKICSCQTVNRKSSSVGVA